MRSSTAAFILAAPFLATLPARAADVPASVTAEPGVALGGFFVGARGGFNILQGNVLALAPSAGLSQSADTGANVSALLGYATAPAATPLAARFELEFGGLRNTVNVQQTNIATGPALASAPARALYGLVNGYVDYKIPTGEGAIAPFAGAGFGFGTVRLGAPNLPGAGISPSGSDTVFAWNLATGLGYTLKNGLTIEAMYRYLRFEDVGLTSLSGVSTRTELPVHQFMIGTRYRF